MAKSGRSSTILLLLLISLSINLTSANANGDQLVMLLWRNAHFIPDKVFQLLHMVCPIEGFDKL